MNELKIKMNIHNLIFFYIFLCSLYSFSQNYENYNIEINEGETLQTILPPQEVYVNSATKIGGKTRVYFPIIIPKNTIRWFYVISTSQGIGEGGALNVLGQLATTTLSGGTSLLVSTGAKMISVPSGSGGVIDSYLLDRQNLDIFTSKGDNFGQSLYYDVEGTRKNFKSGVVMINIPRTGYDYIGIKNPSSSVGVNVKIEAIAIIKENADWERDMGKGSFKYVANDMIVGLLKNVYSQSQSIHNEIRECALNKLMKEQSTINFTFMGTEKQYRFLNEKVKECISDLKNNNESIDSKKSKTYNNLGISYLEKNDTKKAYDNFVKALEIDPENGEAKANLGFLYLMGGDMNLAIEYYIEAIAIFKADPFTGQENLINSYNRIGGYLNNSITRIQLVLNDRIKDFQSIQEMLYKEIQNK